MSWPAYTEYESAGIEFLDDIPSHWQVRRLKQVCEIFPSNIDKKSVDGEIPVRLCNYTDVYYNDEITGDLEFMTATATRSQISKFTLRAGDTIITKDSETADDIANAAYVPGDLPGVVCGYHLAMVRPRNSEADGRFIKRFFDSSYARACFSVRANGLTRVGLGSDALSNVEMPLPPIAEQQAVARFLARETARIDTLIAKQERLIALLQEKRQALITRTVIKGLDPAVPMKDSGVEWLGRVPAHWEIRRLGSLFRQVAEPGHAALPILSVSIHDGVSDRELRDDEVDRLVARSDDKTKYKRVRADDLVYNMMRAWQGGFGSVTTDGLVSPAYVVARPLAKLTTAFVEAQLRTPRAIEEMRRHSYGVTDFRSRLYWESFKTIRVAIPSVSEQVKIMAHVQAEVLKLTIIADKAKESIELMQEHRAALISAAVTGKIDVRQAA